jgi:hypothetical protein
VSSPSRRFSRTSRRRASMPGQDRSSTPSRNLSPTPLPYDPLSPPGRILLFARWDFIAQPPHDSQWEASLSPPPEVKVCESR